MEHCGRQYKLNEADASATSPNQPTKPPIIVPNSNAHTLLNSISRHSTQADNATNNEKEQLRLQRQHVTSLRSHNDMAETHFCDGDDEEEEGDSDDDDQYEQAMDIFVKHFDHNNHLHIDQESRHRQRRPSLPTEDIELTTFSEVVFRQKQQLTTNFHRVNQQQTQQNQQQQQQVHCNDQMSNNDQIKQQHLNLPNKSSKANRPLSISSISSAASSGSSTSSNSSSSSGIHSSLTRNSSLNYSQEFKRKLSFKESLESLDGAVASCSHNIPSHHHQTSADVSPDTNANSYSTPTTSKFVEEALKNLSLANKDSNLAQTRAAILAAGELQRKSFNVHQATGSPTTDESKLSRINRSFHASLRYDKSTAYRIHLMANARALGLGGQAKSYNLNCNTSTKIDNSVDSRGVFRRYSTISRNNSSTSSDSGHGSGVRLLKQCHCGAYRKQSSDIQGSPSASSFTDRQLTSGLTNQQEEETPTTTRGAYIGKAATIDGCHRGPIQHHPNCPSSPHNESIQSRPLRASPKLQQSPSSVSSYSNTSSLFRDDGFEDDLNSTTSEHSLSVTSGSTNSHSQIKHYHNLRSACKQQQFEQKGPLNGNNLTNNNQYQRIRIHNDQELPLLSISQRVVTEIIETERSYVDDLEQIVSGYLCRLRDALEQHNELFSNLEDIYKFNKDFLFQLEECYLNPGSIAACFVENASKFDVYTHYCTMYPKVVSTLTELMAQPTTAQILKERQLELNQSLPLGAYLLKPVQRILKYHILFKSLIKHTTDDETVTEKDRASINEAFSVMTNIACHINEMKKRHEHSIRVQELQSLLCGWEGPDLTTLGELILEDNFKLFNRQKTSRHLLLFDNVLLITKKKRDGSLHYKGHIECANLMLIETIEGQPLVFNTVPFDNPKALCAFQADNLDKKHDWCLQMKEVIIKSFEVNIPHHVRDLLMSLTKTNSISNSNEATKKSSSFEKSGRSLRAPNYLEKKRAKQQDKINNIKAKN